MGWKFNFSFFQFQFALSVKGITLVQLQIWKNLVKNQNYGSFLLRDFNKVFIYLKQLNEKLLQSTHDIYWEV